MHREPDKLERWKEVSQILSAIAIPIVLAVVGWFVQKALSEAGLKKDYVQMALAVLKDPPTKDNAELRQWAIAVLDENSPVPIPAKLKGQLAVTPIWSEKLSLRDLEFTVECRQAPNPESVEWLVKNYPYFFTRCPKNGEVGLKTLKGLGELKFGAWPGKAASEPK